ncbi:hypothetical protein BBJ29_003756 [Phytophthora kernoviae]|uniref:Transposase Tc1-like domain-containing protein n=1 Tax=Phytophthora kernoviae TaxID=325452 RepID=A0A421G9K4_9STRA|nr:hypothetical protein BBJ29_003756 [Phytophthora kernoviae]
MRALAAAVKIPRTTLQRYLARSVIRQVYSRVKPALKAEHKKKRFKFALQHVSRSLGARLYRFDHMYGVMHVDEKWFNLYTALSKFYITTNEKVTYRSCVNKRYIGKIMFLAAVARPRFDFRLKLAGSLEIKSVAMDKNKYKQLLRDIAFPAIFPSRTIDKCFLMLQKVMECTIKYGGGNGFPLPRVGRAHIKNKEHSMSIICEDFFSL